MTIPPLQGSGGAIPPFRLPVLTAPVSAGVPPLIDGEPLPLPQSAPSTVPGSTVRDEAPITLGGRLDAGDVLPDTTRLALALESATRALQSGRAETVLAELDAVWSHQLASDSPWYLRGGALQLLGRTVDAEQVLRDAVARLPRSAAILYLLGVHTAHRSQPDAARLANDHALALHPNEPLLLVQRAALALRGGSPDMAASIMAHVRTLSPSFPADDWLTVLSRLGDARGRTPTPTYQKSIARMTPASLPAIARQTPSSLPAIASDGALPVATTARPTPSTHTARATPAMGQATITPGTPPPANPLEAAVRYGLTLLESPTQSARTATHVTGARDTMSQLAGIIRGLESRPVTRSDLPSWDALVLGLCVVVVALVPPLRIPALMLGGAAAMLLVSRRLK